MFIDKYNTYLLKSREKSKKIKLEALKPVSHLNFRDASINGWYVALCGGAYLVVVPLWAEFHNFIKERKISK